MMLDDDERYSDEEVRVIEPAKMTFVFHLGDGECHQKLTGLCSLEEKRPIRRQRGEGESSYDYCPKMLEWMKGHGDASRAPFEYDALHYPVTLAEHPCGHYSFNDGQHRTCIAKKKHLILHAVIVQENRICDSCAGSPYSENDELR